MIGVIAKPHQARAVQEFFQLFKTPWEPWQPEQAYDVVVATVDAVPEVNATLLVLYGARAKTGRLADGVIRARRPGGALRDRGLSIPIYRGLASFQPGEEGAPAVADGEPAGRYLAGGRVVRLGYDVFEELEAMLEHGQPAEHAHAPTLDLHIAMLRRWILDAGLPLLEIPPAPSGFSAVVCLTHDIDFAGIRPHRLDHTMWGFLYRATAGAIRSFWRGRLSARQVLQNWRAVASLPLVYLGWIRDFWDPFEWYLRAERGLPATYFLVPFKGRAGDQVAARHARRRAVAYDVGTLASRTEELLGVGCEVGVHGLDAWHSPQKGRAERDRIAGMTGQDRIGIRMHWLLRDGRTMPALEEAGYAYDSTLGYNDAVGYLNGTSQVFRPAGARTLLEVPLHIQDGALFLPDRLDLSADAAWARCEALIEHARTAGGVLTVLWHDRSHAPERLWGGFYLRLLAALRSSGAWFATAGQAAAWFAARRDVRFERAEGGGIRARRIAGGESIDPPLVIRRHRRRSPGPDWPASAPALEDVAWDGRSAVELPLTRWSPAAEALAAAR